MIRKYCDGCGDEIDRNYASKRYRVDRPPFRAEVMVATDGTWNAGHICKGCLLELLTEGEEMPRKPGSLAHRQKPVEA